MGAMIAEILPLAIGAAVAPLPIIGAILMLFSERAGSTSSGFLIGWILGIVVATAIFTGLAGPLHSGGEPSAGGAGHTAFRGGARGPGIVDQDRPRCVAVARRGSPVARARRAPRHSEVDDGDRLLHVPESARPRFPAVGREPEEPDHGCGCGGAHRLGWTERR